MWKAILQSVSENPTPNDSVEVVINFVHESGKEFSKSYKVTAGSFKSVEDVKALATREIESLTVFDSTVDTMKDLIGKDILTGDTKDVAVGKLTKK